MAIKKEAEFVIQLSAAQALEAARQALVQVGASITGTSEDTVYAKKGTSIWSLGEELQVQVIPIASSQCRLRISSESSARTTLVDYGTNSKNVEGILAHLKKAGGPQPKPENSPARLPKTDPAKPVSKGPAEPPSSGRSTGQIFLSYRRADSIDITGRIYDRLVARFGKEAIFKDVDSIPLGIDFREYLAEQVGACNILLAVIGRQWSDIRDEKGGRRLEDPGDFVRIEIQSALERNIPVIPLLVQGAQMPAEAGLPKGLKKLAYRNGTQVRPDPDFHHDMDRLIAALEHLLGSR